MFRESLWQPPPDRYAEIDAELQRVCNYLVALADELGGHETYAPAVYALGAITRLRHSLEQGQEYEHIGAEIYSGCLVGSCGVKNE